MDTPDFLNAHPHPTAARPLLGLTILVVEDSRFASEALRLICARSGARMRRADSLAHARRHLMVYRPGCAIIDMGLPDGSGADLIGELATAAPRLGIILGMSGDAATEPAALAAGADGFLEKPLTSVGKFQALILSRLPADRRPGGPRPAATEGVVPDPIAYHDDLHHAAGMLAGPEGPGIDYVARFLAGVASSVGDGDLSRAAADLLAAGGPQTRAPQRLRLSEMVQTRLVGGGQM